MSLLVRIITFQFSFQLFINVCALTRFVLVSVSDLVLDTDFLAER